MFYSHVCTRVLTNPILCPAVIRPRQMMLRLLRRSQQDVASKSRRGQRKSMVSWCSRFFVLSVSMNFYPNFRYPTAIVLANLFLENMEWPQIIHIWWNFPWKKSSSCWGIPPFMETPHMSHPCISTSKKNWISEHFLMFRCRFAWQVQGILHVAKSEQNVRVL